jgi:hypothetical protein
MKEASSESDIEDRMKLFQGVKCSEVDQENLQLYEFMNVVTKLPAR